MPSILSTCASKRRVRNCVTFLSAGFRQWIAISLCFLRDGISFAQVAESIRGLAIAEIISVEAVDLFRGGQVPAGQYSLLVRVTFQSYDATLTEAQIGTFSERIITALTANVGASLRTA